VGHGGVKTRGVSAAGEGMKARALLEEDRLEGALGTESEELLCLCCLEESHHVGA
jgi:hypothetical protein